MMGQRRIHLHPGYRGRGDRRGRRAPSGAPERAAPAASPSRPCLSRSLRAAAPSGAATAAPIHHRQPRGHRSGAIWGGNRSSLSATSGTVTDDGAVWAAAAFESDPHASPAAPRDRFRRVEDRAARQRPRTIAARPARNGGQRKAVGFSRLRSSALAGRAPSAVRHERKEHHRYPRENRRHSTLPGRTGHPLSSRSTRTRRTPPRGGRSGSAQGPVPTTGRGMRNSTSSSRSDPGQPSSTLSQT